MRDMKGASNLGPTFPTTSLGNQRERRALRIALAMSAAFLVAEVAGGILSRSLALLADAGHMLADVASLALALLAFRFAARPATPERTYGYHRAEVLAALGNGVALVLVVAFIFMEAARRLTDPPHIEGGLMLGVAAIGLGVNLISARLLSHHRGDNLNVRGAYLHVVADALGSVGAIGAAIVILTTGWQAADAAIGAGIGLLILWSAWGIIRDATTVLLEATPSDVNPTAVRRALEEDDQVEGVHDLHIWTVTSGFKALSAHLVVRESGTLGSGMLLERLQHRLEERFGIAHATLQIEYGPHSNHLRCLGDPRCPQ